jgi:hypothetical protein
MKGPTWDPSATSSRPAPTNPIRITENGVCNAPWHRGELADDKLHVIDQVEHVVVTKMQADELPGPGNTHRVNSERLVV